MGRIKIPHKLKPNKVTNSPVHFIFFDTETNPIKQKSGEIIHKLKLGWVCYWKQRSVNISDTLVWKEFNIQKDFWDFVEDKVKSKTRVVLIAHNIIFDFTVIGGWTELIDRGWKLTRLYEKNHIFIAQYKKGSKTLLLLDNMNFFATKLEFLGKEIGLKKLDIDFDRCSNKQLSIYCKRDVKILLITWQKYLSWRKQNDLGTFGVTISSQAFNTYRHRFMEKTIYIHNRRYVSSLERESYFGGRTESFKIGEFKSDTYYDLDINSMYPSVMQTEDYPTKFVGYDLNCKIGKLSVYLQKYCCIARVKIKTKKPMFPVRGKKITEPKRYNKLLFGDQQYQDLKKWIHKVGGVKPEYRKINGKIRVKTEYKRLSPYLKRKNGRTIDVLADKLEDEYPLLYGVFNIGDDKTYPGDKLLEVLKKKPNVNSEADWWKGDSEEPDFYWETSKNDTNRYGKVIFPIGQFETVLTSGELKLALQENAIDQVISVALYKKDRIFTDFIKFFYSQRLKAKQKGNNSYSQFYKIIMNSLYGKFGQLMGEWQTCGKCDPKEIKYWSESVKDDPKIYKYRKINGLIQRYEKKKEAFNSFCGIASHVTGYARVKMWKLIEKAGRDHVFYCDTDSLFVDSIGYKNLKSELSPTKIGKLKIEDKTNNLKLFGCKQYVFGKIERHKGRKNNAVKLSDNTYKQFQWSTLKTLIQNQDLKNYRVSEVIKHFTGQYDKGYVNENGNVDPLVL